MKFQYTYLQKGSIRVFRFSQYCTPTFIHGWLEHLPDCSKETSHYKVLSYCPDDTDSAEPKAITLNGRSFVVPSPIWYALSAIAEHHNTGDAYWVDSISINHGDAAERNEQTSLVPTIEAHADQVLAWLGPEDEQTKTVFEAIRKRAESCPYASLADCDAGDKHRVAADELEQSAVRSLLARKYFHSAAARRGVFPEKNGVLLCGRFRCEMASFLHCQRTSTGVSSGIDGELASVL